MDRCTSRFSSTLVLAAALSIVACGQRDELHSTAPGSGVVTSSTPNVKDQICAWTTARLKPEGASPYMLYMHGDWRRTDDHDSEYLKLDDGCDEAGKPVRLYVWKDWETPPRGSYGDGWFGKGTVTTEFLIHPDGTGEFKISGQAHKAYSPGGGRPNNSITNDRTTQTARFRVTSVGEKPDASLSLVIDFDEEGRSGFTGSCVDEGLDGKLEIAPVRQSMAKWQPYGSRCLFPYVGLIR